MNKKRNFEAKRKLSPPPSPRGGRLSTCCRHKEQTSKRYLGIGIFFVKSYQALDFM